MLKCAGVSGGFLQSIFECDDKVEGSQASPEMYPDFRCLPARYLKHEPNEGVVIGRKHPNSIGLQKNSMDHTDIANEH